MEMRTNGQLLSLSSPDQQSEDTAYVTSHKVCGIKESLFMVANLIMPSCAPLSHLLSLIPASSIKYLHIALLSGSAFQGPQAKIQLVPNKVSPIHRFHPLPLLFLYNYLIIIINHTVCPEEFTTFQILLISLAVVFIMFSCSLYFQNWQLDLEAESDLGLIFLARIFTGGVTYFPLHRIRRRDVCLSLFMILRWSVNSGVVILIYAL